jgi:hypothetical protein
MQPLPSPPFSHIQHSTISTHPLRALLPRALLPALTARALLECSFSLDVLAQQVLDAQPPEAANWWLKVRAATGCYVALPIDD